MNPEAYTTESPVVPQRHLVVLRNLNSTNGKGRQDELDELVKLDCWTKVWPTLETLPENHLTVAALAETLQSVDEQAEPESEIVVVSIGGDFTHDASMQGIKRAGLTRTRAVLAAAKAGNKDDTPANLETDYHHLVDIVRLGKPTQIYPLEATVTVEGRDPIKLETIHSLGILASEYVAGGVNKDAFPKGNIVEEVKLAFRAVKWARRNALPLEANNVGLKNGRLWTDFIIGAGKYIAGGMVRFHGSALTDPNRLTFAHSVRSWPSILGGVASRLYGAGPGYRRLKDGNLSLTLKGLERIQIGGEVLQIQEDPARKKSVTVSVGRGQPITALTMQRPNSHKPKHRNPRRPKN